jgi:hypothetical protein
VNQRLTRTEKHSSVRFEHLFNTFNHAPLNFGSEVDQHVAQENHIECLAPNIQWLLDQIQAPVLDTPTKRRTEFEIGTVAHEMAIKGRSRNSSNRSRSVDTLFGIGEGIVIHVSGQHAPLPGADGGVVGEHDGQGRGLFPAGAAGTPHPKTSFGPPSGNLSEDRIHQRLELGRGAKKIGFFDRDLAEDVPPFL